MKKLLLTLLAVVMSISAMAFNYAGKTFKGAETGNNGNTVTVTAKFRADGGMSMTYSGEGYGTQSDTNMHWEEACDHLNISDSTGHSVTMIIGKDANGKETLSLCDDYGTPYLILKYVATSSKSTGKSKSKRR